MIVASQFGWGAVSRHPMSFADLLLAAQLMSEERVGKRLRQSEADRAREDMESLRKLKQFAE